MSIQEAIETIEALYPPDSQFEGTNQIGEELLQQAKRDAGYHASWQELPGSVLLRYAELCEQRVRQQQRTA